MENSQNMTSPLDETPLQLQHDSLNLIGSTTICGIAYGVMLTLLVICAFEYSKHIRNSRPAMFQLIYISIMAISGTLYVASNTRTIELAYVFNRNFPEGPAAYNLYIFSEPITVLGVAAYFIANWMSDALLLWRLSVIYRSSRYHIPVLIGPTLLLLTSFSMSVVTLIQSTRPNSSFWSTTAIDFALAYYSLTVSLTIVATTLMILRLLTFRRRFKNVLGEAHAKKYTSIVTLLVESSALCAVWSVIFLGLYIVNHPVQFVFLASLAEVQIISPLLILYRVCKGTAWSSSTEATLSTMDIRTRTHYVGSQNPHSSGTVTGSGVAVHVVKKKVDEEYQLETYSN
ncbi:hypothetical protein AAF712_015051 [Marasmius tenuissimus]|uniref:Uncharacterized protein n=1 Tax=Marasmius tenuissimus TaxID=585030 RepID=A0ABR2ZAH3_9AGAR